MREFFCPHCHESVFFEKSECVRCSEKLSFDATRLTTTKLENRISCGNRELMVATGPLTTRHDTANPAA